MNQKTSIKKNQEEIAISWSPTTSCLRGKDGRREGRKEGRREGGQRSEDVRWREFNNNKARRRKKKKKKENMKINICEGRKKI